MNDRALSLLGLMRKAGALNVNENSCMQDLSSGKSKMILASSDSSPRLKERFAERAAVKSVPFIELNYTKSELSDALGTNLCAFLSVNDAGFAQAFLKLL